MMWNDNGYWVHSAGWEGWVMLMFMIVFVVAIIVAIVYLVRYLSQSSATSAAGAAPTPVHAPESPNDILKRRYASGEIEREEYLQKLGDL